MNRLMRKTHEEGNYEHLATLLSSLSDLETSGEITLAEYHFACNNFELFQNFTKKQILKEIKKNERN